MEKSQIVEALQKEAKTNPASSAVFHVFASRERARSTVMLTSLYNGMKKEGFSFSRADYVSVLKLLNSLGFGTLYQDSRGRVLGLKNVKTTLQSIGEAALGNSNVNFQSFRPRNRYTNLQPRNQNIREIYPRSPLEAPVKAKEDCKVNLEVDINGKTIHIPMTKNLTSEDIASLINRLQSA